MKSLSNSSFINHHSSFLLVVLAEGLDLDVHARWKIELHQRVNCLRRRIEYVHKPLVRSNLELLARLLIHVRAAKHGVLVLHRRQRNGSRHSRARSLGGVDYLSGRLVKHAVVISLQPDSDLFVQHFVWSLVICHWSLADARTKRE